MRSVLSVDVTIALPRFTLRAAFDTGAPCAGVFGVSGAGKSTLLEALAGLRGAQGRIEHGGVTWLDASRGVNVPPESRGVGYVPQEGLLFPHWSVGQNVLAGAGRRSRGRAPDLGGSSATETRNESRRSEGSAASVSLPREESAAGGGSASSIDPGEVVRVLDLKALMDRNVGGLSGGERQRVALARALCSQPSLLLLDEPLGSIDRSLRSRILPYLLAVKEAFAIPTVFVSHDAAEVEILCDEVLVMHGGRIVATGRPHEILTGPEASQALPGDAYENVLEGVVARRGPETLEVLLDAGPSLVITLSEPVEPGARVLLGIRAAEILIAREETPGLSARNVLPGIVRSIAAVDGGDVVRVSLGEDGIDVAVMVTEAARQALGLNRGASVRLVAKARSFRLLAVR